MDLSSWREKIARDAAGAAWGSASGEEEEEDDGPAVLVEQQTDSAMEPAGPPQERYKDGVVTIGCVGEGVAACGGRAGPCARVSSEYSLTPRPRCFGFSDSVSGSQGRTDVRSVGGVQREPGRCW